MPRSLWIEEGRVEKRDGCLGKIRDAIIAIIAAALLILVLKLSQ